MKKLFLILLSLISLSSLGQKQNNKEAFKRVNSVDLFYRSMGEGEPIIAVHGGPGLDEGYFHPSLDPLSVKYKLISYDQRGSGRSKGILDTARLTVDQYVEDIEGLRKSLGLKKMHLMGHSFGAFLSLLYASKYPDHLYSIILVGSGAKDTISFPKQNKTVEERTSKDDTDSINKMVAAGYFNTMEGRSKLFPILWKPYVHNKENASLIKTSICDSFLLVNSHVGKSLGKSALWSNLNERLIQLTIPVLIIHGDYDPVPLSAAETNHRVLKESKIVVLKDCGHFPFIERQEEFTKVVEDFLESIGN